MVAVPGVDGVRWENDGWRMGGPVGNLEAAGVAKYAPGRGRVGVATEAILCCARGVAVQHLDVEAVAFVHRSPQCFVVQEEGIRSYRILKCEC